jgi:hypothetical protein
MSCASPQATKLFCAVALCVPGNRLAYRGSAGSGAWFKSDVIVDRISQSLFTAKIVFRCFDTHVAKQELDLLQFSSCLMTKPSACSPKIVQCDVRESTSPQECFMTPQMTLGESRRNPT